MIAINPTFRKAVVYTWLCVLLTGICYIFWHCEWKYSQPTPVPPNYKEVKTGVVVNITTSLPDSKDRPTFLHFFNPDCPCSRFNMTHFKSLVTKYGNRFYTVVVVVDHKKKYTAEDIREKYDIDIPVIFDTSIALTCGVYSTPQAVILDKEHHLYFRGNYNKSRYCINKNTDYARIAIDSFLNSSPTPPFEGLAYKAYGCQIFSCTKK